MGRRIAIVGAGQSGLQLGLGLLGVGHSDTLVSNRTAAEVLTGPVQSSQCMFESALATERAMGLDFWAAECPPVDGIAFTTADPNGSPVISWAARLDRPAQSVDQRVKLSGWMNEFERRGGTLAVREADVGELDSMAKEHDLTIVATGRGALGELFAVDEDKSPYREPMRALALTYVRGMAPRPEYSAVSFNLVPGVGEYFVFPALTTIGACEIMVFEGIPGVRTSSQWSIGPFGMPSNTMISQGPVVARAGNTKYSPTPGTRLKDTAEYSGRGAIPRT